MNTNIDYIAFIAALITNEQTNSEVESEMTISKGSIFISLKRDEDAKLHIVESIADFDALKSSKIACAIYEFLNPDEK